jgi:hypothetical protein
MSEITKGIYVIITKGIYAILITLSFIFLLAIVVEAHEWYDDDCCNENDCAPAIKVEHDPTRKGMWITTKHSRGFVAYSRSNVFRASQDQQYHACFIKQFNMRDQYNSKGGVGYTQYIRCVYVPGVS